MKILVTGGTGFLGSHIVARLVEEGHELRLLIRSPDRVRPALAPLGLDPDTIETVVGDVTIEASVRDVLAGMDAVVHAASVYSLDSRRASEISATNEKGATIVLRNAIHAGLDPILYVSSVAALLTPKPGSTITVKSPPMSVSAGPYFDSKAAQEVIARRLQSEGAPVAIVYPGAVLGPHDPHWGDGSIMMENILRGRANPVIPGCIPVVDVRDIAHLHGHLMQPGHGPRRYMFSGTSISFVEMAALVSKITGRRISCIVAPDWLLRPLVEIMDTMQNVLPFRLPTNREAFTMLKWNPRFDDSPTVAEFGLVKKELEQTISDMIRWMCVTGGIPSKLAGLLTS